MEKISIRIKIEWGLLLFAIILLSVYIFIIQDRENINYTLPSLPVIEMGNIDEILIANGTSENGAGSDIQIVRTSKDNLDNSYNVEKGDEKTKWLLSGISKPANRAKVEKIITALSDLTIVDLISERDNYSIYGLDDQSKKIVSVIGDGEELFQLEVGNLSDSKSYSYIKFPGEPGIYSLRGNLATLLKQTKADLRDKGIFSLNRDDLKKVSVESGEGSLVLTFTENRWLDQQGQEYSSEQVDPLLFFSSHFMCTDFSGENIQGLSPLLTVKFSFKISDGSLSMVELHLLKEENGRALCVSSTLDEPFYVSNFIINPFMELLKEYLK